MIQYDKDKIKNDLTIEQVHDLVADLGGNPQSIRGNYFISQTICHNRPGEGSYKLYYYDNTKLFKCYTACNDTFDIFELVSKVKNHKNLFESILYVLHYFQYPISDFTDENKNSKDWEVLQRYEKNQLEKPSRIVEMKIYDGKILNYLPRPRILSWEKESIKKEVMDKYNICYNPSSNSIIIPHYNKDNQLIGIRERTLVTEVEKTSKYKPAILNNFMYNHPLGFNLYGLNLNKNNIKKIKKAVVFEGEKSVLKYASYFGNNKNISVACCGSSITSYQIFLLLSLGVQEIVIAFDKQFQEIGDKEWQNWVKKLTNIHNKYSIFTNISFLFDKENLLDYKDSPIDKGETKFLELFEKRVFL